MSWPIFSNLKKPTYLLVALGSAFILFDISVYFMLNLVGTDGYSCIPGGNFTIGNIVFSGIISIMTGIIIAGLIALIKQKQTENQIALSSLSGLALIIGTLTIFCGVCTLPILSAFGLATIIHLFVDFNIYFKLASIILLAFSLYQINRQLSRNCGLLCKTKP